MNGKIGNRDQNHFFPNMETYGDWLGSVASLKWLFKELQFFALQ